jgi:hypothetical protein
MKSRVGLLLLVAVLAVVVIASCSRGRNTERTAVWTPAAVTTAGVTGEPTMTAEILPTNTPRPVFTPRATATRSAQANGASAAATKDPKLVKITEADVQRAIESGMTGESGASQRGLKVRFLDGKMRVDADYLSYGPINVENLMLIGKLVAVDGKLQLETESVTPRGLIGALIPTVANQALEQYTSKWYVEDVQTYDGYIEVRTR